MTAVTDIAKRHTAQPRARGRAEIGARLRGGLSRLSDLRQEGSAKVLLPRATDPGLQAVILNTAGGITGGDRFAYRAAAGPGARLSLTTQAAERAYRAQPQETGHVHAHLTAAEGARIDWLPQETILFDGSALSRRLEVDLAPDATLLAVEPLIFGRAAMGERLRALRFSEQWRVRRAGRLVFADALRLQGPAEEILAGPATLAGHRAMASILLAAPDAERFLAPLRTLCPASLIRPGILAARITAPSGFELRHILLPALELLRGAPLPKVWTL